MPELHIRAVTKYHAPGAGGYWPKALREETSPVWTSSAWKVEPDDLAISFFKEKNWLAVLPDIASHQNTQR